MNLSNRSKFDIGFTGFGEFATSVFTVYQAASQVRAPGHPPPPTPHPKHPKHSVIIFEINTYVEFRLVLICYSVSSF